MTIIAPLAIVLDTSPLSLLTQKTGHALSDACKAWYTALENLGSRFYVLEIADYEVRRELLRAGKTASVRRLDVFIAAEPDRYLPLTTPDVRLAAQMWAQARQSGHVTAPPEALDGDILIAAQACRRVPTVFALSGPIIATENARHFASLAPALLWSDILP